MAAADPLCVSSFEVQVWLSVAPSALAGHGVEMAAIPHHKLDAQMSVAWWYSDNRTYEHLNSCGEEIPVLPSRPQYPVLVMGVGYGDETKLLALVTCSW